MKALVLFLLIAVAGCQSFTEVKLANMQKYVEKGRYQQALYRLEGAFAYQSDDPQVQAGYEYWKARAYEGLGRKEEAIGVYRFIIDQFPDTLWKSKAEAQLKLLEAGY